MISQQLSKVILKTQTTPIANITINPPNPPPKFSAFTHQILRMLTATPQSKMSEILSNAYSVKE